MTFPLFAHPHVWVDVRSEILVDKGRFVGIQETWALDEEFSQLILTDGDTNGNGKIDPSEVKAVKSAYFDNLKRFDYFTHVFQGQKVIPIPQQVEGFQAVLLPSGKMQYQFLLTFNVPLASGPVSLSFYDDTFYVDVEFEKKEPVSTKVSGGGKATVTFRPDKSKAFWGGEIVPNFVVISWSP
jgi:ABC-type uncharacterized transport system substrate-binding protein